MPQDQDDIKGADAMKQAPTPGPLDSESVKLLVKGDYIRGPNGKIYRLEEWGDGGFLTFIDEPHDGYLATLCAFIGRPDADGWMPWYGGDNPIPGQSVEVRQKWAEPSGGTAAYPSENWTWAHSCGDHDIIAFRLAPTAPVEASGSEREEDAFEALAVLRAFPSNQGEVEGRITEKGSRMIDACCFSIEAALHPQPSWSEEVQTADTTHSRRLFFGDPGSPQPSGETREAVASDDLRLAVATVIDRMAFSDSHEPAGEERRKTWLANKKARIERAIASADEAIDLVERSKPTDERSAVLINTIKTELLGVQPDSQGVVLEDDDWRLILTALIRPAPLASGGQHSSGPDEPTEEMIQAALKVDLGAEDERWTVINLWQTMKAAAPVAETAGEAVDIHRWAVVSSDFSRPFLVGAYPTLGGAQKAQCGSPDKWLIYERAKPAVPAQDDDKLREAIALAEYVCGLLPSLSGAADQPDNKVYAAYANKREIMGARDRLAALQQEG